jgi:multiple sugar transport system substrate-binding protein
MIDTGKRRALGKAGALALLIALPAVLAGCTREPTESHGRKIVRVWHVWGGTMAASFRQICATFSKEHPNIDLRPVFAANDLGTNQKFFTAVAAGKPPEVIFVDGPQVASWAEWGALEPLTQRCKQAGIKPEDYFPPCWRQTEYKGQVWALTFCADPNFGFVWNKALFRKAGLDPNKPPQTIAELDRDARILTHTNGQQITQIGLIPWGQYGEANSLFTWGWAFGGSFYDPKTHQVTADNPGVVRALQWMTSYSKQYDVTKIAGLQQTFGSAEQNPFITGKVAMECLHIGGIDDLKRYAPNLDYGVSFIPAPPGGEPHSSWVGGWCVAIPKGAANPDAAWEFIHWLCATPEGTSMVARAGLFPGYRPSPAFAEIRGQKAYGQFLNILEECKHQRPVMPVQARYMRELTRAVDSAIYGRCTPREALAIARRNTQAELDLVRKGSEK